MVFEKQIRVLFYSILNYFASFVFLDIHVILQVFQVLQRIFNLLIILKYLILIDIIRDNIPEIAFQLHIPDKILKTSMTLQQIIRDVLVYILDILLYKHKELILLLLQLYRLLLINNLQSRFFIHKSLILQPV